MGTEFDYEGDYFGDRLTTGYRSLTAAMASGLDIRLDAEVTHVTRHPSGVTVTGPGLAEEGSHAVVTVPLGVLKRRGIQFSPELPPGRLAAAGRLGFGRYEKVALRLPETFWVNAGWEHLLLFPPDPGEPTVWVIGDRERSTLTAMVFHTSSARVHEPSAAVAWIVDMLKEAVGPDCPEPLGAAVTDWGGDPFSCGGYSHVPTGATPGDLDLLGEPIAGRILFAGEHTQSRRVGYADGAMTSGIREAKRLTQRPAVRVQKI